MSGTRQPAPSWSPTYFGSPQRGAPLKLRVHASLKSYRWFSAHGESLFWQPRSPHFPLQEQLGSRFSTLSLRGINRGR
jgi:hypothetical protein